MNNHFSCLFVRPPNKNQSIQDYYTASKHFPVNAHFEYSHNSALVYLKNCTSENFPTVIILEEAFSFEQNLEFIEEYRAQFYLFNIDTLLYTCKQDATQQSEHEQYPEIISDSLPVPFDKQIFMEKVFPSLTVHMV